VQGPPQGPPTCAASTGVRFPRASIVRTAHRRHPPARSCTARLAARLAAPGCAARPRGRRACWRRRAGAGQRSVRAVWLSSAGDRRRAGWTGAASRRRGQLGACNDGFSPGLCARQVRAAGAGRPLPIALRRGGDYGSVCHPGVTRPRRRLGPPDQLAICK